MEIMQFLESEYGFNTPILLNELNIKGMTKVNLRQTLTRLTKQRSIERYAQGVYYIPKMTPFGKSKLSAKKVYEKKYISNNCDVYGFYSGLALENSLGLTTQMPNVIEIVTNNEGSRLREVQIGNQKVRLRKSKVQITAHNAKILQLLDLMNNYNIDKMSSTQYEIIVNFIKQQKITKEDVYTYIKKYPSKVAKKMIESRIIDELI